MFSSLTSKPVLEMLLTFKHDFIFFHYAKEKNKNNRVQPLHLKKQNFHRGTGICRGNFIILC